MMPGSRSRIRPYPRSLIGLPQQSKEQPCAHPQVSEEGEAGVPHSLHSLMTFSSNPQLSHTYTWFIFISLQLGMFSPRISYDAHA